MGYAKRVDATHAEVRQALRKLGYTVGDLSRIGDGWPDLLAVKGARAWMVEVKSAKGKLRASQSAFQRQYPELYVVLRSAEEAIAWASENARKA